MWKRILVAMLLVGLCGCIKIKDELTINADGSGKVRIETLSSLPPEMLTSMGLASQMAGAGDNIMYPPANEAEAHKFFPAKDFKVTVKQEKAGNGDNTLVIEAEFKDLNALLASPYGRAHQLAARIADGSLVVQGVNGMEAVARLAGAKDDNNMLAALPGLADLQKKTNEMRAEFRVTLPNAISSASGAHDGKTAVWLVERAKCKDADDFATQMGALCEARCPADGLKLAPVTPVRLGLHPFAELATGVASVGTAVDTNKIAAAAKFVPYGLTITRALDLTGEGNGQQNSAELTGAVILPPEFEPQKWGTPTLQEAVDAKGTDLKPADNENGAFSRFTRYSRFSGGGEDDSESATNTPGHVVTINFRPPDWKVSEIARVKGTITLQYFGGAQVIKLTNAIAANAIVDPTKMMGGGFSPSQTPLKSDDLTALGLTVTVTMAMAQSGMTMLTVQIAGKGAAVTDAEIYDAAGKPWPTFLQQSMGESGDSETSEIIVAGKPQPPLSLALVTSGTGAAVDVPIEVEHIPLTK
jgi:hypothetical protein